MTDHRVFEQSGAAQIAQQEVAAEQAYVDNVYERLEASGQMAQALVAEGYARGHIGHEGGLVERDAMCSRHRSASPL